MLACTWARLCCDVTSIFWNTGWTVFLHSQAVYPTLPCRVGYAPVSLRLCFWYPALWGLRSRLCSSGDVVYDVMEVRSCKWHHSDDVISMMSWVYDVVGQWHHPVSSRLCLLATCTFLVCLLTDDVRLMMLCLWCHLDDVISIVLRVLCSVVECAESEVQWSSSPWRKFVTLACHACNSMDFGPRFFLPFVFGL